MRRLLAIVMGFAAALLFMPSPAAAASREMEDLGADCPMVLPPSYLKTDADGLLHYFAEISEADSIPIMVQDAPPGTRRQFLIRPV